MGMAARAGRAIARASGPVAWLLLACACAGLHPPSAAPTACWPRFPYQSGWLGADGAFSVPLSPTRSVWLFGDTFVGSPEQTDRVGASFVHNSIGVSTCDGERFDVRYVWGRAQDGAPRAFLERGDERWWWLFGGFVHGGRLYLGLLELEKSEPHGPLSLGFRSVGTALARIDDPRAEPESWRPEILPLTRSAEAMPLSALVIDGAHLFLFAFVDRGDGRSPRILLRLPLARLDDGGDLGAALETFGEDGAWLPGFSPSRARILMDDDATEMSVRYHAEIRKWIALYNYPDARGFPKTSPSDAIYARSADRLEGPWSPRRLVFRVPELASDRQPPADRNTGCYAAKEQPGFSLPGSLTFTYVCNLFAGTGEDPWGILQRLQHRMDLYRPIAAAISVPGPGEGPEAR